MEIITMVISHNFKSVNNNFTDIIETNQPNSKESGQKHRENGLLDQNILSFYSFNTKLEFPKTTTTRAAWICKGAHQQRSIKSKNQKLACCTSSPRAQTSVVIRTRVVPDRNSPMIASLSFWGMSPCICETVKLLLRIFSVNHSTWEQKITQDIQNAWSYSTTKLLFLVNMDKFFYKNKFIDSMKVQKERHYKKAMG